MLFPAGNPVYISYTHTDLHAHIKPKETYTADANDLSVWWEMEKKNKNRPIGSIRHPGSCNTDSTCTWGIGLEKQKKMKSSLMLGKQFGVCD